MTRRWMIAAVSMLTSIGVALIGYQLAQPNSTAPVAGLTRVPAPVNPSLNPRPQPLEPEPPIGEVPDVSRGARVPMPLDPYKMSLREILKVRLAVDLAAADCMRELGHSEWTPGLVYTYRESDLNEIDMIDYLDVETARAGYPRNTEKLTDVEPKIPARPNRAPSQAEAAAYGDEKAQFGCLPDAHEKIYGNSPDLPADARSLAIQASSSALADSRVQAARQAWQGCMAKAGLPNQGPMQDPGWATREGNDPATPEEKHLATVDATCRAETRLVGLYKVIRAAHEQRLLDANRPALEAANPIIAARVARAQAVIDAA